MTRSPLSTYRRSGWKLRLARWLLGRTLPEGVHIAFVADGVLSVITAESPVITVTRGPSRFRAVMGRGLIGPSTPYAPPWIAGVEVDMPTPNEVRRAAGLPEWRA